MYHMARSTHGANPEGCNGRPDRMP
jgi:hypothetical protein